MIVFVTDYDGATAANRRALALYLPEDALVGAAARRETLVAALREAPGSPLAVWSHGSHGGPCEQGGQTALSVDLLTTVAARRAYVYACHTGTSFGGQAAAVGWTWWGYTGAVSAPGDDPQELAVIGQAFWATLELFQASDAATTTPERMQQAQDIAARFEEDLDELSAAVDNYLCLLHLWSRLRAWLPGRPEPVAPTGAGPLFIL